jgi:hypothetical protein
MGGALPLERDQLRLDAEQLLGFGAHLGVGDVVLGTERPVLRQRLLGELLALALQGLLLGQRSELALHRFDPAVERRQASGFELGLLGGRAAQALLSGGQAGFDRGLGVAGEAGLAHVQNEQRVALPHQLAFAGVGFDDGRVLRGDEADDASIRRQEAGNARLAGVLTGPEKGEDQDGNGQNETRRDPQGDGTGQLDGPEPRLSVAVEDFAPEEVGHDLAVRLVQPRGALALGAGLPTSSRRWGRKAPTNHRWGQRRRPWRDRPGQSGWVAEAAEFAASGRASSCLAAWPVPTPVSYSAPTARTAHSTKPANSL